VTGVQTCALPILPTIANGIVFTSYPSSYGAFNQMQIEQKNINKSQNNINNDNHNNQINNSTIHQISHVLVSIELKTGKILWQKRIDGDVMSAPVAEGNELYLSTFAGTLFKFKQKTGEIISAKSIRATSAPVIDKDEVYISQRSDKSGEDVSESLVNYSSGSIQKQKTYNKKVAPYLDKDVQGKSKLKELSMVQDAGNGFSGGAPSSSNWMVASDNIGQSNVSSLQSFQGSRALHHQGFNYNTMGDEIICTDVRTGKETWKQKIKGDTNNEGGFMGTPPLMAGNRIVLASFNGEILIIDPKDGKQINQYKLTENIRYQPIVEEGWIYVTTTTGKLVAINTTDKELTGWPMWGANPERTNIIK
jgi:outer membrane protein assembly factor BamB